MKKILTIILIFASVAGFSQERTKYETGPAIRKGSMWLDSIYVKLPSGTFINLRHLIDSLVMEPVPLDTTLKYDEDGLGLDTTSQVLKDFIAAYGGGGEGGGGSGTVSNSANANRLAVYAASGTTVSALAAITASRALASDANGLPVASAATSTELGYLAGVTSAIQTQLNAKAGPTNITAVTNGSDQVTVNSSTQTGGGADFPAVTTTTAGILIPSRYNRSYTRQTATWSTGTVTVNINNGGQVGAAMSTSGDRTLAFSNLAAGDMCKISMNNTSGGSITLTLPSNSFVQNTTTGVYESAASVTVPSGRTILTLTDFDGTNYLFVY